MATEYLFNSGGAGADRISLQGNDADGVLSLEVKNAANASVWTHTLTGAERVNMVTSWRGSDESITRFGAAANNRWMALTSDGQMVFRNSANSGNADTVSNEVVVNAIDTAAFMTWVDLYTQASA